MNSLTPPIHILSVLIKLKASWLLSQPGQLCLRSNQGTRLCHEPATALHNLLETDVSAQVTGMQQICPIKAAKSPQGKVRHRNTLNFTRVGAHAKF